MNNPVFSSLSYEIRVKVRGGTVLSQSRKLTVDIINVFKDTPYISNLDDTLALDETTVPDPSGNPIFTVSLLILIQRYQ